MRQMGQCTPAWGTARKCITASVPLN